MLKFTGPRHARLPLTQGKTALIDEADLPLVKHLSWHATHSKGKWYAATNVGKGAKRRLLKLATLLMGSTGVDHINGDGLDNRRSNLRVVTQAQNTKNRSKQRSATSSPYKGVSWHKHKQHNKWSAYITANGHRKHLGYFSDPVDAAKAYDSAARELFGEFAKLNIPASGKKPGVLTILGS